MSKLTVSANGFSTTAGKLYVAFIVLTSCANVNVSILIALDNVASKLFSLQAISIMP